MAFTLRPGRTFVTSPSAGSGRARPARLDSLTGLRFLAAGVVFLHHGFELTAGTLRQAMQTVFAEGRAGVSFFFVLSGFVMAWSWRPEDRALPFYRRRVARIWPAYTVAMVVGYLVSRWFDHRDFSLSRLATDIAMLQSWIPSKSWYFSADAVGWSVSCEAFFYLAFPLYVRHLVRLRARTAAWAAAALVACMLVLALLLQSRIVLGGGWVLPDTHSLWLIYICPAVRMMEFVLGALLVVLLRSGRMPHVPIPLAWGVLAVAWVLLSTLPAAFAMVAVPVAPFALLIVAYAERDQVAPRSTIWSSRALVWLGGVSYCFYLVHQMVIRVFTSLVTPQWLAGATGVRDLKILALVFVVALLGSWALHALVERPFERWIRGRPRVRSSAPADAPRRARHTRASALADRIPQARPPTPYAPRALAPDDGDDATAEIPVALR